MNYLTNILRNIHVHQNKKKAGLVQHDLNSMTYSQDSKSWCLTLIGSNLTKDANLDFYVEYFLPIILQLDKMRELESK